MANNGDNTVLHNRIKQLVSVFNDSLPWNILEKQQTVEDFLKIITVHA